MKQLWALRYLIWILFVFVLVIALVGWAVVQYPLYVGIVAAILVAVIAAMQPRIRKERERTRSLVDASFQNAYAPLPAPPAMKVSSSYGYPAFEIKFRTKAEMDAAAARNEVFKAAIGEIFKGYGPRSRPFSADMAIFFTYDGYIEELRARIRTA